MWLRLGACRKKDIIKPRPLQKLYNRLSRKHKNWWHKQKTDRNCNQETLELWIAQNQDRFRVLINDSWIIMNINMHGVPKLYKKNVHNTTVRYSIWPNLTFWMKDQVETNILLRIKSVRFKYIKKHERFSLFDMFVNFVFLKKKLPS